MFYGFDHLQLWVGNAKQAADWYCMKFGMRKIAYRGLETGSRDAVTHVVRNNKVRGVSRVDRAGLHIATRAREQGVRITYGEARGWSEGCGFHSG